MTGLAFTNNVVTHGLDWYSGIVRFEGNDHNVTITGNNLYANTGPAVAIDTKGFPGDDSGFTITGNNIYGNGTTSGSKFGVTVNGNVYDGALNLAGNYWGSSTGPQRRRGRRRRQRLRHGPRRLRPELVGDGRHGVRRRHVAGRAAAKFATAPVVTQDTAYWGLAAADGARIQAEDFDEGGQGVGYSTTTTTNAGGQYRTTGVGIEATTDAGGGYDVGWTAAGEWLDYAVNLTQGGTYRLDFRLASPDGRGHVPRAGRRAAGGRDDGRAQHRGVADFQTVSLRTVPLTAGPHTVRVQFVANSTGGSGPNFNWFQLTNTAPVATRRPRPG